MTLSVSQFNPSSGEESRTHEEAELYALTCDDRLMPSVFVRWENGREVLRPVGSGREYSFPPDRVMSRHDGEKILFEQRVRGVADNYSFTIVANGIEKATGKRFQVIRCDHPTDKRRSYTMTVTDDCGACSCKSFSRPNATTCKHIESYRLLHAAAPSPAPAAPEVKPASKSADGWDGTAAGW